MKLLHIADLHLGKRLHGFSLLEDQQHALNQITALVKAHKANAVLIAGDVFDKATPAESALVLLDEFLTALIETGAAVFLIAGNHDSALRLEFGSRLLMKNGLYISGAYNGTLNKVRLKDEHGPVDFYLLPYVRPAQVQQFFIEQSIKTHEDAVRAALSSISLTPSIRSVLLAHQYVSGEGSLGCRSASESAIAGGLDRVCTSAFPEFDYIALGHLHKAQAASDSIYYSGTPLKYDFSETLDKKGALLVELLEKGSADIKFLELTPLRDMLRIQGKFSELIKPGLSGREDYYKIILEDEYDVLDAMNRIREFYPNAMQLSYEREVMPEQNEVGLSLKGKAPLELFEKFYSYQNDRTLDEESRQFIKPLLFELESGVEE